MYKVFIVVQNLRIGGFQRIALDEAYGFIEKNYFPTILLLENYNKSSNDNFFHLEKNLIEKLKLKISIVGGSRWNQFKFFRSLIKKEQQQMKFVSHNLRATVLIRFASVGYKSKVVTFTTIHQIPSLSALIQRVKRFLYSLFSDYLFSYSIAVKKDWTQRVNSFYLSKLIFKKKQLSLLRNGVYLERLPKKIIKTGSSDISRIRLIYLGRNTSWKGITTLLDLAMEPALRMSSLLFIIPSDDLSFLNNAPAEILERVSVQIGKSFSSYVPQPGDIHIYPTNYGKNVKHIESISINCLEMACVGVPSFVTMGGLHTWQDLESSQIFIEVNWNNLEETSIKIAEVSKYNFSDIEVSNLRDKINISNHIYHLLDCFSKY